MDRRQSLQWMLAAAAAAPARVSAGATPAAPAAPARRATPTDPDLLRRYRSGELWPLQFDAAQRRCAAALCALIIPADAHSPGAAELEVQVFIDEWVSAPYPEHLADKSLITEGLAWLDAECRRRFEADFAGASPSQQREVADDICWAGRAAPERARQAAFFARFRDLTAGGFYTTPAGTRDLGYVGNTPMPHFDGPPPAVIRLVGVQDLPTPSRKAP